MNMLWTTCLLMALGAQPVETSPTPTTRLYVRTVPPGARVVLDGNELGMTDGLFLVPPGGRVLRAAPHPGEAVDQPPITGEKLVPRHWVRGVAQSLQQAGLSLAAHHVFEKSKKTARQILAAGAYLFS